LVLQYFWRGKDNGHCFSPADFFAGCRLLPPDKYNVLCCRYLYDVFQKGFFFEESKLSVPVHVFAFCNCCRTLLVCGLESYTCGFARLAGFVRTVFYLVEPGNQEFWLPLLPLSVVLFTLPLGIIWNITENKFAKYILRFSIGTLLTVVVLIFVNYNLILPKTDPVKNPAKMAMEQLGTIVETPLDLVVIMGWDELRIDLNYYVSQDFISIYWLTSKHKYDSAGFLPADRPPRFVL
jgi:hypothetical protein